MELGKLKKKPNEILYLLLNYDTITNGFINLTAKPY